MSDEETHDDEERQKQRIRAILAQGEGEADIRWEIYLKQHLPLPLQIEVYDGFTYDYGPVQIGDRFEATEFLPLEDETYGQLVRVSSEKGSFKLPLADLRPLDKTSPSYQLIEDYAEWLQEFRDLEPEYW